MKHDPGMHIGMHLVFFGKSGVTPFACTGDCPCPPVREQIKGEKPGRRAHFPRRGRPSSVLFARTSVASRGAELRRASTQGRHHISILVELVVSPSFPPLLLHPWDEPSTGPAHQDAARRNSNGGHRPPHAAGRPEHLQTSGLPQIEP
jgi:hypothetical protein